MIMGRCHMLPCSREVPCTPERVSQTPLLISHGQYRQHVISMRTPLLEHMLPVEAEMLRHDLPLRLRQAIDRQAEMLLQINPELSQHSLSLRDRLVAEWPVSSEVDSSTSGLRKSWPTRSLTRKAESGVPLVGRRMTRQPSSIATLPEGRPKAVAAWAAKGEPPNAPMARPLCTAEVIWPSRPTRRNPR